MEFRPLMIVSTVACCLLMTTDARALEGNTVRLFGMAELGVGGTMSDDAFGEDLELSPSYGGAIGIDVGLHAVFALGVMGRFVSFKPTAEIIKDLEAAAVVMATETGTVDVSASAEGAVLDGRSTIMDIDLYPRLRLPMPGVELYCMLPVGFSKLSLRDDAPTETGWNLGVHGGIAFTMVAVLQIIGQVGYSWHFFETRSMNEMNFNLGLALGF